MQVGTVGEIWRYPVKSMGGERLEEALVGPEGIPGDRGLGVVDTATGKVLSGKTVARLLGVAARWNEGLVRFGGGPLDGASSADDDIDDRLSSWLGRAVQLRAPAPGERVPFDLPDDPDDPTGMVEIETPAGRFFDSRSTLHLLSDASLRAASASHPDGDWHPARFRPNLLVEIDGVGFAEDGFVERRLRIGEVEATVRKVAARCVLVVQEQPGLPRDSAVFRSLVRDHGGTLGIYVDPRTSGRVRVGDAVELVA